MWLFLLMWFFARKPQRMLQENEPVNCGKQRKKCVKNKKAQCKIICCAQVSPDGPFCTICGLHWGVWQRHADQHRRGSQRARCLHAVRRPVRAHDHQGAPAAIWPDQGAALDTARAPWTSSHVSNRSAMGKYEKSVKMLKLLLNGAHSAWRLLNVHQSAYSSAEKLCNNNMVIIGSFQFVVYFLFLALFLF